MKKFLMLFSFLCLFSFVKADDLFELDSETAVMIEQSSKTVLYNKNMHKKMAPASMTKMMTLLLVMEAVEDGRLNYDQLIYVSEDATKMGGSQVYLEPHTKIKLYELIKAVGICSANDASVVLAEAVGGNVHAFVAMMNKKARDLGLKNTYFKNPHGLDESGHYSSAYDMAIIASELVKHKDILKISSTYESHFVHPNGKSIWMVNTNNLLKHYPLIDGLKTGYTSDAGYCLTATKEDNGMRIITVTMNASSKEARGKDTIKLMEYAYSNYEMENIFNKGKKFGKIFVDKGKDNFISLKLDEPINFLIQKNDKLDYNYKIKVNKLKAPLYKGDKIGTIIVNINGKTIHKPLFASKNIKKLNLFQLLYRNTINIISGNIIINK